jgi:hypothetical protein
VEISEKIRKKAKKKRKKVAKKIQDALTVKGKKCQGVGRGQTEVQ